MKRFTLPSWEKHTANFRNEGDNIALALTINVNILAKLVTIITLCTCLSRIELERKIETYPK